MKLMSKAIFVAIAVMLVGCLGTNSGNPLPGTYQVVAAIASDLGWTTVAPVETETVVELKPIPWALNEAGKQVTLDDLKAALLTCRITGELLSEGLATIDDIKEAVTKLRDLMNRTSDDVLDEFNDFIERETGVRPIPKPEYY